MIRAAWACAFGGLVLVPFGAMDDSVATAVVGVTMALVGMVLAIAGRRQWSD